MKKLLTLSLAIILITTAIPLAHAISAPTIDPYNHTVDAPKIKITGKTEANAKIVITGGPYELPPTQADSSGKFSVTLALTQEATNNFSFVAEDSAGNRSEAVTIQIVEGKQAAQQEESSSGKDLTAPEAPEVNDVESPVDAKSYKITGSAEKNSVINVTGSSTAEAETDSTGKFEVTVTLKQNTKNTFYVSAVDTSGNVSESTKVEIVEAGEDDDEDSNPNTTEKIAAPFTDILDHWGAEYIENLRLKGMISGKEKGVFAPNDPITRAELTKIALNAAGIAIQTTPESPFPDVETGSWYINYIYTAKQTGIVSGFPDGYFQPNAPISRAAALKILIEAAGREAVDSGDNFNDCPPGEWFAQYTSYAKVNNIVGGYEDGGFHPGANITRAGAAKITVTAMGF